MTEQEKVLKGLKACAREFFTVSCLKAECPYWDLVENESDYYKCTGFLARDALELLKEQEPVKPKMHNGGGKSPTWWYVCGACGHDIDPKDKFCRECGKAVKWDAAD